MASRPCGCLPRFCCCHSDSDSDSVPSWETPLLEITADPTAVGVENTAAPAVYGATAAASADASVVTTTTQTSSTSTATSSTSIHDSLDSVYPEDSNSEDTEVGRGDTKASSYHTADISGQATCAASTVGWPGASATATSPAAVPDLSPEEVTSHHVDHSPASADTALVCSSSSTPPADVTSDARPADQAAQREENGRAGISIGQSTMNVGDVSGGSVIIQNYVDNSTSPEEIQIELGLRVDVSHFPAEEQEKLARRIADLLQVDRQAVVVKDRVTVNIPAQQYENLGHAMEQPAMKSALVALSVEKATFSNTYRVQHQEKPDNWTPMRDDEEVKVVPLSPQDPEYTVVESEFKRTLRSSDISIKKIERIQNRTLHDQYMTKKRLVEKQNPGVQNERKLWHGTAGDAVTSINHYGFNRSYCGKNSTVHGNGVYFAVESRYSAHSTYSPPDASGDRHIYYAQVLTGEFTTGNHSMRAPPVKRGHILYDSVVDNMNNPSMFVIFNDTQAYPDYLITFR